MKRRPACVVAMVMVVAAALSGEASPQTDEQQALRARIEQRYDVVPLTDGVALTPKSKGSGVRLILIADTIAVDGVPVTGRELRERVGAEADAILRLSYLDATARRELFRASGPGNPQRPEAEAGADTPRPPASEPETTRRSRRSSGDRVRIFGNVTVPANEEVGGQVVAVLGSVRVDGEVGEQVVAVLGSVDLGPNAIVRGDVVAVGGRVRRAEGAQVRGGVTEVSLADAGGRIDGPWLGGWGPIYMFGGFGAVPRLILSTFHFGLLAFLACIALVVARRSVEGSAQRVTENPVKATLVGLAATLLFGPVCILITVVLAISIVGIPLLFLMPFAVLVLLLMALVGFSGTAYAVGQWTRRRFGIGTLPAFVDVCLGVLVILMPLLVGRVVGLAGWPVSPFAFLLLATGMAVEFLAWSSGFGAVLANAFGRWQATRRTRAMPPATL